MIYGIEAASFHVPSLYLEIKDLAEKRNIEPAKLEKGLGLHKMAFPDVHEDAATFAAEALLKLIKDYNLNPKEISRIYLGTESALDAANLLQPMRCKWWKQFWKRTSEQDVSKTVMWWI